MTMKIKTTDPRAMNLACLPVEARRMLKYEPEAMMERPSSALSSFRHLSLKGEAAFNSFGAGLMGTMLGTVAAMGTMVGSHVLGLGDTVELIGMGCTFVPASLLVGARFLKGMGQGEYDRTLRSMRERIARMTSTCSDDDHLEALRSAKALSEQTQDVDMVLLMKIDAIAQGLENTIEKAGPDLRMAQEARDTAERAVVAVISSADMTSSTVASQTARLELEEMCSSLSQGSTMAFAAPTPRLSRILSLANRALAKHPDMQDAGGARIDHLVRVHVPRLLALRSEALETARTQDIENVDKAFDAAFDGIVTSIEEGMASVHGETMDRLSTEMRFLTARREEGALQLAPIS